jgi:spore maturation protein CgeB
VSKEIKKKLNLLIYGEPFEWAMAANLIQSFEELGHNADLFDYTQFMYRTKKYTLMNRALDRLKFNQVAKNINTKLIDQLNHESYDVLLVLKGVHLFPESIFAAKKRVDFVVNWNPDDFFNSLNNSKHLLESFSIYDCIFTARSHLIDEYRQRGVNRVEIIDWCYLPKYQHPVEVSVLEKSKYGSNIVFVGSWSTRREQFLAQLFGMNIKVWGGGWKRAQKQFKTMIECNPPIFAEEMCKVVCSSEININMLTIENNDTTNFRNFEVPACCGFQLSERSGRVLELFEENKEIACFSTPEELALQCSYFLEHQDEREQIRTGGFERVIKGKHSMLDRAKQIIAILYD